MSGFVYGGIATRVVSPLSKLVNPQHVQPVHPKRHGPIVKKKTRHYEKNDQEKDRKKSEEFPAYRDLTHTQICEMLESALGQVNRVIVVTSGTIIRNGHGDSLATTHRGDQHLLPAKRRSTTRTAIPALIFDRSEFHCNRLLRDTHLWRK